MKVKFLEVFSSFNLRHSSISVRFPCLFGVTDSELLPTIITKQFTISTVHDNRIGNSDTQTFFNEIKKIPFFQFNEEKVLT